MSWSTRRASFRSKSRRSICKAAARHEREHDLGHRTSGAGEGELHAPAELQGAFIAAGHAFDTFAAVGKALGTATADVFIVDPYADAKVLTDYAVLAPETVSVRVLAEATHSRSLKPAAQHWPQQMKQPLDVRIGAPRSLHDRLILIDGKTAFVLGQSFKDLATRAHTSLVRMPPEAGKLKIEAYELMWSSATPL